MSSEAQRQQAVAYLLGELTPVEREGFELRLRAEPELRSTVDELRPVVQGLSDLPSEAWEAQAPPPLDVAPKAAAERSRRSRRRRFTLPRLAWVGAAAGAVAVAALVLVLALGGGDDPAQTFELRPLAGADEEASATVELASVDDREATFRATGLPPSPADHHYELWLLGEGDPVPLRAFTVEGGAAEAGIELPADPSEFEAFDVSVERDDGDPSHSGDSVLRGPAATSAA